MTVSDSDQLPDFFRALVQGLPDLVWIKNADGMFLACNRRVEALLGCPESEIVGKTDRDFVGDELAAQFRRRDLSAITAGCTQRNEERLTFASDGHVEHVETLKTPLYDAAGGLIGVLGIARDISDQVALRENLQRTVRRLQAAERIVAQGSWEQDPASDALFWSDEVHRIFGTDPATHQPSLTDFLARVHPEDLLRVQTAYADSVANGEPYWVEHRIVLPDGKVKHVVERAEITRDEAGQVIRAVGTVQDVTERVLVEQAARERADLFAAVVTQSVEGVAIINPATGAFVEFNDAASQMLGYSRDEFAGLRVFDLEAQRSPDEVRMVFAQMTGHQAVQIQTQLRHKNGDTRQVVVTARGIDVKGERYIVGNSRDVTEMNRAQDKIKRLSQFDQLTGLPNRQQLAERLQLHLAQAELAHPGYVLLINLERFHAINDALGRPVGDAVLTEVAQRLSHVTPNADGVVHLGGDEFVLLVPPELGRDHADTAADALRLAHAVLEALQKPLRVGDHTMELGFRIGTTSVPHVETDSVSEVLRRADTALHRAKRSATNRIAFFDEGMGEAVRHQFDVEQQLRTAIPAGQLRLYLQAQVNARGRLMGAEALVRWQRPERGLVPPSDFIPVAEESGLIVQLDRWMLDAVLPLTKTLRDAGQALRVAVNVSPKHFHSPDFVSWLQEALARHGAGAQDLILEVTEGLVIENVDEVVSKMGELKRLGFAFSIDDFGTGYSSLAYLKRLPIDELKIDRSFVNDATQDADSVAIISTILAVAHHMSLEVVAEGIETPQQVALLAGMAPQIRLQGFHFSRPMEAPQWLAQWAPGITLPG